MVNMATHLPVGIVLLLSVLIANTNGDNIYRLCVTNRVNVLNRCQTVKRGDSQVECVPVADSVDCALKMQQGDADFGVFTAEEALLASDFIDKSVRVVADIRHVERSTDPFAFEAVAVVKNTYGGTLNSLKGSNFCHPGFAPGGLWTDSVLKHFERFVVSTPCEKSLSVVEQEIKALSHFFKSACRPGPWVQDDMFDNRLKMNYSNLCELCDSPKTCSYASHESGSHRAALTCLTHRGGDVAYVALRYLRQYFGLESGFTAMAEMNDFKILCPDGSTEPLDNPSPCAWVQQPWSGVLARRDIANTLQPLLLSWLVNQPIDLPAWQEALWDLMMEPDHIISSVSSLLSNFVRQIGGETRQACSGSVKWCTVEKTEKQKCEWLKAAVQTHGIQPSIDCVEAKSNFECWGHVRDGIANIVTVDTEYGYIVRKSFNLSPLAYLDSGLNANYQILAIINSSDKQIKSWQNIRQKKACFPEFGGLAWISTVATLIENRQLARMCPHAAAMGSFFGGACAPGAKDIEHTRGSGVVPAKLCSVCSTHNSSDSCSTTSSSVYYGDLGALRCLANGFGNIAFVDYRQLQGSNGRLAQDIDPSAYRVLCRNGSLAQSVGLNVDNNCALSYGVGSEIVARADRSETRNTELTELLLEMDQWFGSTSPSKMDSVFHMYSEFQGTKDLLFKDATRGLVLPNDVGYSYVNDYKKLQDINSVCVKTRNSGVAIIPSIIVLIAVFISPFVI
uniref:Transferrin n=1 Tax=Homalodisca liturata TaxID=320908 RepID=A0A1B6HWX7_9HEMI